MILTSTVIAAVVAGAVTLIQFFISRKDKKSDKSDERDKRINSLEKCIALLEKSLEKAERDNCRIQMLILLNHYSNNVSEIMKVAEHYASIGGNWYMTSLFNDWLDKQGIDKPIWWEKNERE